MSQASAARAEERQPRSRERLAILVPCFNEEATIGKVVADFRAALPEAAIYVYDNNSADRTVDVARAAGALVRREMHQGKGNVVRRMFADVDADVYVLVDGDATYDAASAHSMITRLIEERLDMVVGARIDQQEAAYRPGHRTGQPAVYRLFHLGLPRDLQRRSLRLPRVLSAVRQVLSCAVEGLRDRDRAFRARART